MTKFDLAIVPDHYHSVVECCPHCESTKTEDHAIIELIQTKDLVADAMLCSNCNKPYLIVEYPVLEEDGPIMTKWHLT